MKAASKALINDVVCCMHCHKVCAVLSLGRLGQVRMHPEVLAWSGHAEMRPDAPRGALKQLSSTLLHGS